MVSKAVTGTLTATDKSLPLDGTLASGETYVVHRKDADPAICSSEVKVSM